MTPICRIFIIPPTTTASMRVTDLILTFHPHNHQEKCLECRELSRWPLLRFQVGRPPFHHTKLFIQERFFTIHQKSCRHHLIFPLTSPNTRMSNFRGRIIAIMYSLPFIIRHLHALIIQCHTFRIITTVTDDDHTIIASCSSSKGATTSFNLYRPFSSPSDSNTSIITR